VTLILTHPERAAQELLETIWADDSGEVPIPVNPVAIAERLGIKVFTAGLSDEVSGMLVKRGPDRDAEIYLNVRDSQNRQRFTCAHELGHYVRRSANGEDGAWEYIDRRGALASEGTDAEEVFANQFAASLLMPPSIVKELAKDFSLPTLAAKFGVSTDAMSFRLQNLGLK
jgi:Zn-dependent peptidase ImmA (M78 family)